MIASRREYISNAYFFITCMPFDLNFFAFFSSLSDTFSSHSKSFPHFLFL
jgi:hypothetical protein